MSSTLQIQRRSPRSVSPNTSSNCSPKEQEPSKKCTKLEKDSDCKTSCSEGKKNGEEKKDQDSPAFRLRPRRSTPKPTPNSVPTPGKRFSLFAAMMAQNQKFVKDGAQVKRKLIFNKQKVYPPTLNSEDQIPTIRVVPPRSPSGSVTENISVSPFVQKISPCQLEPDKDFPANYVSLKIIFREKVQIDNQVVLKVIATQIDDEVHEIQSTSKSNTKPKNVTIYLYGSYAHCKADVNKVINIVKFKTIKQTNQQINDNDLPYAIVVKSIDDVQEGLWVPFVSITNKWEPPKDPRELNRTLFMTPPDESAKVKKEHETNSNNTTKQNTTTDSSPTKQQQN